MLTQVYRSVRFRATILLTLLFAAALFIQAPASEPDKERRVVRVAFPQVQGMSETSPDGTRHGLIVDYLNEIAKYTDWDYKYIDVDGGTELLERFSNGEFDLMGGNYYMPELEEYYAYPDYNTGYSRAALLARRDDQSIRVNDLESLNGKTIGVYTNAKENIRRLKEYLSINNLRCPIKEYAFDKLTPDGDLYPYLESGEVDLLLGNFTERGPTVKIVVSYDSQPYYIVTTPGNQEILDGLNMALELITDANPDFGAQCFNANFTNRTADILLTTEQMEYVREKKSVTVAVAGGWHPLFCKTTPNSIHEGLVSDVLNEVREYSGLEFRYLYADSYIDAIRMVQDGRADIMGFYLESVEEAARQGLAVTSPYASLSNTIVRNKASSYPDSGLTGGIVEGRKLPASVQAENVRTFKDIDAALSEVNRGEIDFVYGLPNRIELEIQHRYLTNLVPVTLINDISNIGFALRRPADRNLLNILNKAINSLSPEEKDDLLNRNLVSIGASRFSLKDFVYANPVAFVMILSVFLLIAVAGILLIARTRVKAAVMQSNLEKAEAASQAKGEFLSRMSHEIRTPMNAIVGLTDLTSMMENVPADIQDNLSKLRASSQYLLSLINDILDMSRIESGKLSISSEPFSLKEVIDNIQSMMSADAGRRGLELALETSFTHSSLQGDAVRLRQILMNLLSNAFKFTPAGGKVTLRITETGGNHREASFLFQVIDTGTGIRPEDQERIFAAFEQLGSSSAKSQGTGLGLAISNSIVRLMGSDLKVRSQPDKGSEFYFTVTLPVGEYIPENETLPDSNLLENVHILMAEDNDLNAEIATELLSIQGATVCRAENGALVLEKFQNSEPGEFQMILMDVQMPQMNGLEATRAIRGLSRPDAGTIPIIAMTANSFQEDVEAAKASGMNAFISKPLNAEHLFRILHGFVS